MPTLITLTEAATFLGVSKATLRNWDNDGKLVAVRNPINGYRQYDMESLIKLKNEMTGQENSLKKQNDELKSEEAKAIKRAVNKLHCIIRDSDANSNIVTRFDEISKLLFVRLMSGRNIFEGFEQKDALYSSKIQVLKAKNQSEVKQLWQQFSYQRRKRETLWRLCTQIWGILKLSCFPKKRPKRWKTL